MNVSRLYLPKLDSPPSTILEYLYARFPRIDPEVWRERVCRGVVTLSDGTTLREDSRYRHGVFVFYRKEVPSEPAPTVAPSIIFRDQNVIVVDKPHGMPVTPVGRQVRQSLLVCLQELTGLDTLTPLHRLDRDTAGLLLISIKPETRGTYHRLFAHGLIEKEYSARARVLETPTQTHWVIQNRLEQGDPWFRQRIVEGGEPNAITEIELLEVRDGIGNFRLIPKTGKKHQLRIHMASIGFPILGDPFYPAVTVKREDDPPLQLIAARLSFVDPETGVDRCFISQTKFEVG